jgi:hypothetical protein
MIELNITRYFADGENDPYYMSNSTSNLGSNAARITWQHSLNAADGNLLTTDEALQAVRDWLKGFGAWDDAEIAGYSSQELEAFVLQDAASAINEILSILERDYEYDDSLSLAEIIDIICNDSDYRDELSGNIYIDDDDQIMIVID